MNIILRIIKTFSYFFFTFNFIYHEILINIIYILKIKMLYEYICGLESFKRLFI